MVSCRLPTCNMVIRGSVDPETFSSLCLQLVLNEAIIFLIIQIRNLGFILNSPIFFDPDA